MSVNNITNMIKFIRRRAGEPANKAKWPDADLIEQIADAYGIVIPELLRLHDFKKYAWTDITIPGNTEIVAIPPTVGEFARLAEVDPNTGRITGEITPRSSLNPFGSGLEIHPGHMRIMPTLSVTKTLRLIWAPLSTIPPIAHTALAAASVNAGTIVFPASPTTGTLTLSPQAYAGMVITISKDAASLEETRVIRSYDHTTRTATLFGDLTLDVASGTFSFEVLPWMYGLVCKAIQWQVASELLTGAPGMRSKKLEVDRSLLNVMRTLRLQATQINTRSGGFFQQDIIDNPLYAARAWAGWH